MFDDNDGPFEPNWHPFTEKKFELLDSVLSNQFGKKLAGFPRFAIARLRLERYSDV